MTQWDAADYARNSRHQRIWAQDLIAKLHLRGDERILDIGCGDGKVTAQLAAAVSRRGSVVGIDNSDDMIRFATEQFTPGIPNLSFRLMDAAALSFDREFDVVFSNAALHWVRDHRPVLHGIARALRRPGGRVLLQMGGQGNAADVRTTLDDVTSRPEWADFFRAFDFRYGFYSPDEYRPWLADAGLDPVRVELVPKHMEHADRQAFGDWFRTTWMPWTHRVPPDRRNAFIEAVVDTYVRDRHHDDQGIVSVKMVRLEVEAQ
jgi:trans-aconitate methyltransferase